MLEIWKDIEGYGDRFQISNFGNFKNRITGRTLSQTLSKKGYPTHATRIGGKAGKAKCFKIHILVATAFVSNPNNKPFVNHIDGVKTNNHFSNLEWVTASENELHAHKLGLKRAKKGSEHVLSKLTNDQIIEIRRIHRSGDSRFGTSALARRFKVSRNIMKRIISKVSYQNV